MDLGSVGKYLLIGAAVLGVAGLVLLVLGAAGVRLPFGRLPGDLTFGRGNTRVFIPLATSLVLSVLLTVVLNLILRR